MSKQNSFESIRVIVYRAGQAPTVETIVNTLAAKQEAVGGLIETFRIGVKGTVGICNEEGLLLGLPLNRFVNAYTAICGDFLVVGEDGPEFTSLSDEQIQQVRACL